MAAALVLGAALVIADSNVKDEPERGLSEDVVKTEEPDFRSEVIQDLSTPYNSLSEEEGWLNTLWGRPFRDKLYLGMWTLHFDQGDDQENNNKLVGATYKGYYGGTFINTHGDRVLSAGWQRTLFQQQYGAVDVEAGYRTGIMYGYKKYLKLGNSRLFPLFQALLDIEYKRFGVQFSWAGVVVTAGVFYRY